MLFTQKKPLNHCISFKNRSFFCTFAPNKTIQILTLYNAQYPYHYKKFAHY